MSPSHDEKTKRLSAALRANLRKRKGQARDRTDLGETAPDNAPDEGTRTAGDPHPSTGDGADGSDGERDT